MFKFFFDFIPVVKAIATEFGESNNVIDYVNHILPWLYGVLGGIALLTFVYAGFLYMTSQGNPESINKAKEIIVVTISGILLLFLAGLILQEVGVI